VKDDSPRRRGGHARPRPRDVLRSQLRATVRATILDAAEELIGAKGLHGAALAEIARTAGVAVGTLYNYFEDRDALVRALFETRRATLRPLVLAAIGNGKELAFEPRLRQFMRALFEAFESHRRYIRVVFEAEHLKPTGSHQDLIAAIDEIVAVGVAEGAIARPDAELLAIVLSGSVRAVLMRRSASGGSFVDETGPLVDLVLDGARVRPEARR